MNRETRLYLLIHTMTIADCGVVIQAQFVHTFSEGCAQLSAARLIGRRVNLRVNPVLRSQRHKIGLLDQALSLKRAIKRKTAVVKHHLRTVHIGPEFVKVGQHSPTNETSLSNQQSFGPQRNLNSSPPSPEKRDESSNHDSIGNDNYNSNHLTQFSNTDETVHWLTINRFDKYLDIFAKFSGSDMLRMSKEDFIQICGQADGIRLYNALHLKTIAPKLKLYICRDNMAVFSAIFLSSHNHMELVQKLCTMVSISIDQVKSVYIEGPHSIHIQLSDDVLRHVEEEAMFSLTVIQDNGLHVLMLKRRMKN